MEQTLFHGTPQVLRRASEGVFVPLTVGGGIRGFTDAEGRRYSALDVAAEYFRSGADKVSIGSEAVDAALEYMRTGEKTGKTAIEQISWVSPGLTTDWREGCDMQVMLPSWATKEPTGMAVLLWHRVTPSRVRAVMQAYGAQAVVVSIDPRRVHVTDPASTQRPTIQTAHPGPNGEQYCW